MVVVFVKNLSVLKQEMSSGLWSVYVWCSVDATMHQLLEMILSVVFHWVNAEYKQTQPLMMIKYCKRQWTKHKTNSVRVCVCRILHFIIRICENTVISMLLGSLILFFNEGFHSVHGGEWNTLVFYVLIKFHLKSAIDFFNVWLSYRKPTSTFYSSDNSVFSATTSSYTAEVF